MLLCYLSSALQKRISEVRTSVFMCHSRDVFCDVTETVYVGFYWYDIYYSLHNSLL
jgi:hypothetical protein